jgi:hypothetical protein
MMFSISPFAVKGGEKAAKRQKAKGGKRREKAKSKRQKLEGVRQEGGHYVAPTSKLNCSVAP